jgi:hypothetical protein
MINHRAFKLISALLTLLAVSCSNNAPVATGGTDTETGGNKILGTIVASNGQPAVGAMVSLIPEGYNAVTGTPATALKTAATDKCGNYCFTSSNQGVYNIQASDARTNTRLLLTGIVAATDSTRVPTGTLQAPASGKISLPQNLNSSNGYVFIPGTTIGVAVGNATGSMVIDSLPSGSLPSIYYAVKNSSTTPILLSDPVTLGAGTSSIISSNPWAWSRQLGLNTTPSGAGVSGTVVNFPVLIRLTASNFNFNEAQGNGNDLRFAKTNGGALPYEIERWDPTGAVAEVWVRVDTVYGNDATHAITMYWGNPTAPATSSSTAVFDTASGFQGVWHLAEVGSSIAYDATVNHYNGTMSNVGDTTGMIGTAKSFNGTSSLIDMAGTASGKLNFPQYGVYAISAWVFADTILTSDQHIVGKGNWQYSMRVKGSLSSPPDSFTFEEYTVTPVYRWDRRLTHSTLKSWKYIAAIRKGTEAYLYIDGVCMDSVGLFFNDNYQDPRVTTTDFSIGSAPTTLPLFFMGLINEVRVSSIACSPDWVKLCFENQKADDQLITMQ